MHALLGKKKLFKSLPAVCLDDPVNRVSSLSSFNLLTLRVCVLAKTHPWFGRYDFHIWSVFSNLASVLLSLTKVILYTSVRMVLWPCKAYRVILPSKKNYSQPSSQRCTLSTKAYIT